MTRIAITTEAFDAISATLPLGSIGFERHPADDGQWLVWLEPHVLNKLRAVRGPGALIEAALSLRHDAFETKLARWRIRPRHRRPASR